jgi:6,7-dimethyl-8-ribityllumazine synthase
MLKAIAKQKTKAAGGRFVIVASRYNDRYVGAMLRAAQSELKRAGAAEVKVVRVPGAFEIPVVAAKHARTAFNHPDDPAAQVSAIICLGVILRGQTVHAEHIGSAVSDALMAVSVDFEVPVIHEVLLLENEEQARARCLDKKFNRGREAAQTALAMAGVMWQLKGNARR